MPKTTVVIPRGGEPAGLPLVCAVTGEPATKLLPRQVVVSSGAAGAVGRSVLTTIVVSLLTLPFGFIVGVRRGARKQIASFKLPVSEATVAQVVLRSRLRIAVGVLAVVAFVGAIVGMIYLNHLNPSYDPWRGLDRWFLPAALVALLVVVLAVAARDPLPCRLRGNGFAIRVHPAFAAALEERRAAAAAGQPIVTGHGGAVPSRGGAMPGWGPAPAAPAPTPLAPMAPAAPAGWGPQPVSTRTSPIPPAPGSAAPVPISAPPPVPAPTRAPAVAAGWLADPSGRFPYRWWDGATWTSGVSDANGNQQVDPPV